MNAKLQLLTTLQADYENHLEAKGVEFAKVLCECMEETKDKKDPGLGKFIKYFNRIHSLTRLSLLMKIEDKTKRVSIQIRRASEEFEKDVFESFRIALRKLGIVMQNYTDVYKEEVMQSVRLTLSDLDNDGILQLFQEMQLFMPDFLKYKGMDPDYMVGLTIILIYKDITSKFQPKKPKRPMRKWDQK